jgi:hypothetical protein
MVHLQVVFPAGRAVAFAGIFIAQAGQLVASADAIAVARLRSRFDRNERHYKEYYVFRRFCARACSTGFNL